MPGLWRCGARNGFAGGPGVLLPAGLRRHVPVSASEVVFLWQPPRVTDLALLLPCLGDRQEPGAGELGSGGGVGGSPRSPPSPSSALLAWGAARKVRELLQTAAMAPTTDLANVRAAVKAFIQHADARTHRRECRKAELKADLKAELKSECRRTGSKSPESEAGSESGCGAGALVGQEDDEEPEEDEKLKNWTGDFEVPAMYRCLITLAGHFDDSVPVVAQSPGRAADPSSDAVRGILGDSPFDAALVRVANSFGIHELRDSGIHSERALLALAPDNSAVHHRSLYGHLY
mmetsp:Transcript_63681/g.143667  ORF Transcript_63681/g.143667 Transcript_63681/m.143667 type:complete len:290 (-) Transcript_63681:225-1094(-)